MDYNLIDILKDMPCNRQLYSPMLGSSVSFLGVVDGEISVFHEGENVIFFLDEHGHLTGVKPASLSSKSISILSSLDSCYCAIYPSEDNQSWEPGDWQMSLMEVGDYVVANGSVYGFIKSKSDAPTTMIDVMTGTYHNNTLTTVYLSETRFMTAKELEDYKKEYECINNEPQSAQPQCIHKGNRLPGYGDILKMKNSISNNNETYIVIKTSETSMELLSAFGEYITISNFNANKDYEVVGSLPPQIYQNMWQFTEPAEYPEPKFNVGDYIIDINILGKFRVNAVSNGMYMLDDHSVKIKEQDHYVKIPVE